MLIMLFVTGISFYFLGQGYRKLDEVTVSTPLGPITPDILLVNLNAFSEKISGGSCYAVVSLIASNGDDTASIRSFNKVDTDVSVTFYGAEETVNSPDRKIFSLSNRSVGRSVHENVLDTDDI